MGRKVEKVEKTPKKHSPNEVKYEFIETNYVNGIPFPRLPVTIDTQSIPLQQDYPMRSMDYLDTPEAYALFEKQADLIIKNGWKGIIDVGCRHGPVNDILHAKGYTDYRYMGFDTSTQPIQYANETWQEFNNIEYRVLSWNDFKNKDKDEKFGVNFDVDVMIWSGVLLYEPEEHLWYFDNMQKAYAANNAIIQEPLKDQREECWSEDLELNTIEDKLHLYKEKYYEYDSWKLDLDIFSGRRIVSCIKLWEDDNPEWSNWDSEFGVLAGPPRTEILPCGLKVIPYIFKGKLNMELSQRDQTLCQVALIQMDKERHSHRLADNYNKKGLHLDKMFMYNFVFDGEKPVFCSGVQTVNKSSVRVFSRYFAFEQYKTDGTTQLDKNDDFEELRWVMKYIRGKIIFWSRDKSPKFFEKLKEGRPDVFSGWQVHKKKINIIYADNEQYIFYVSKLPLEEQIEFE